MSEEDYYYSEKYEDDKYEYRHVIIAKDLVKDVPKDKLMTEREWRALGIRQSKGWEHYMVHPAERHARSLIVTIFKLRIPLQNPRELNFAFEICGLSINCLIILQHRLI
ncbi:unnamed protein product [Dracunculus medinensis]|uniref:Cyclin-dependent kinases regulatory subunit n=1 Tax=Dracunculus medinensis TaxID=318479 RepID=A0A0N4U4C8_DRAME|nr:unnamed protein product [Dracunculus medinensis]